MNSNQILRTGETVSAATQAEAEASNPSLVAGDSIMEATIAEEVLTVLGFPKMTRANSKLVRKKVGAALKGHTVVEIDLSQTTSINFSGLCVLLAIRKMTRGGNGVVRLVNPTPPVQQWLNLVRAGEVFEMIESQPIVPDARATSFSPSRLSTF